MAATADVREGVRVAAAAISSGAGWARALAELGDDLADVTSTDELVTAGRHAARLLGAEDVSLMWSSTTRSSCSSDNKDAPGERWRLADFPATARLLDEHVPGQVVVGDAESDPDEIAELVRLGYGAVLMVPVRVGGGQRALVEVYRVHPQAFTRREVDRARVVAQQFGPVLARRRHARQRIAARSSVRRAGARGSQPVAARSRRYEPRSSMHLVRRARARGSTTCSTSTPAASASGGHELRRRGRAARADVVDAGLGALGQQPVGAHDVAHVGEVASRVGVADDDPDRVPPARPPPPSGGRTTAIA